MSNPAYQTIIRAATETRNIDFKEPFSWSKSDKCGQFEILKDIAALANAGGGHIIVGRHDNDFKTGTMSPEQIASFDPTEVNKAVRKYLAPHVPCVIQPEEVDADTLIVIAVPDFDVEPLIFQVTGNCQPHDGKSHFREGELYIRTSAAQSVRISNTQDMRDLLNRCVRKNREALLVDIDRILSIRQSVEEPMPVSEFTREARNDAEIGKSNEIENGEIQKDDAWFFRGAFYPWVSNIGHFMLIVHPTEYQPNLIPNEILERQIRLFEARYSNRINVPDTLPWDTPASELEKFGLTGDDLTAGVRLKYFHPKWKRYEAASLRTSGMYRFTRIFPEDYNEEGTIDPLKCVFHPMQFIETVTMMHLLARNVGRAILPSEDHDVQMDIRIDGLQGRKVELDDPSLNILTVIGEQGGTEPNYYLPLRISLRELEVRAVSLAAERIANVFWSFGLSKSIIEPVQRRLLGNSEPRAFPLTHQ